MDKSTAPKSPSRVENAKDGSDEANYFLQQQVHAPENCQHHASDVGNEAPLSDTEVACEATDEFYASGSVADGNLPMAPEPAESAYFACGDDFMEQVYYQPFRILATRELAAAPFATFFTDTSCLSHIPDNFFITPWGFYRALEEVWRGEELSDEAILTAMVSRYGAVPDLLEDEDIVYSDDLEPCVCDEEGQPLDPFYWSQLLARRAFWHSIQGSRQHRTI